MLSVRPDWLDHAEKQLIQQGLTNQVYRLSYEGRFYFYRRTITQPEKLFIHRTSEASVLETVSPLGMIPDVYFYADDGQEMLTAWVNEPQWDVDYFSSDAGITQLAALCSRIHQLQPLSPIHQLSFVDYLSQLSANLPQVPGKVEKAKRSLQAWLQHLPPIQSVLCHNDINPTNLLGKKPWLIDWEYAALGDPAFELACIANAGNFTETQFTSLVLQYQETGMSIDPTRVRLMRRVVDLVGFYWCERMLILRSEHQSQYRCYQAELLKRIESL